LLLSGVDAGLDAALQEADGGEPAADEMPHEVDQDGHEGREERGYRCDVLTESTQGAFFNHADVLGGAGTHIVVALDVGNGHQHAVVFNRYVQRRDDRPVARIEDQTPAHAANDGGEQVAAGQQQDGVEQDRTGNQDGREAEVHGEVGPAPEVEITVDPLTEQQSQYTDGGAPRLTEAFPQEVLYCRREGDEYDRGHGDPQTTVFPVGPEVPVTHGEHGVNVVGTADDEEENEQAQVVNGPGHRHRFGVRPYG